MLLIYMAQTGGGTGTFDQWTSLWNVVTCRKGLLHVQVWVKMDQGSGNMMTADQRGRTICAMERGWIQDFKIEGTWPANEGFESLLHGAPFQITRDDMQLVGPFLVPVWSFLAFRTLCLCPFVSIKLVRP
jgi:hypothetical protein